MRIRLALISAFLLVLAACGNSDNKDESTKKASSPPSKKQLEQLLITEDEAPAGYEIDKDEDGEEEDDSDQKITAENPDCEVEKEEKLGFSDSANKVEREFENSTTLHTVTIDLAATASSKETKSKLTEQYDRLRDCGTITMTGNESVLILGSPKKVSLGDDAFRVPMTLRFTGNDPSLQQFKGITFQASILFIAKGKYGLGISSADMGPLTGQQNAPADIEASLNEIAEASLEKLP